MYNIGYNKIWHENWWLFLFVNILNLLTNQSAVTCFSLTELLNYFVFYCEQAVVLSLLFNTLSNTNIYMKMTKKDHNNVNI